MWTFEGDSQGSSGLFPLAVNRVVLKKDVFAVAHRQEGLGSPWRLVELRSISPTIWCRVMAKKLRGEGKYLCPSNHGITKPSCAVPACLYTSQCFRTLSNDFQICLQGFAQNVTSRQVSFAVYRHRFSPTTSMTRTA